MNENNEDMPQNIQYRPNTLRLTLVGLVLLVISIAIVAYWKSQEKIDEFTPPPKPELIIETKSINPSSNQIIIPASGFASPRFQSKISAEVTGKILSISELFAIGNRVSQGDILLTIDATHYKAVLAEAQANLATAKSLYAQEEAKSRQAARDVKRLQLEGSSNLSLRKPQLEAARATVANAQAQLKLAQENLSKTEVKAPFDAIIKTREVSLGDTISANSILTQLIEVDNFNIKLSLSSLNYKLVSIGDAVNLTDPISGQHYNSSLSRIDPELNKDTRTLGVYVDIKQPQATKYPLLSGSYLQANIITQAIPNSQWIDNISIIENQFVWFQRTDGTLGKMPIELIYRGDNRSLVRFSQAISAFIVRPKDYFTEGKEVKTKPANNNDIEQAP